MTRVGRGEDGGPLVLRPAGPGDVAAIAELHCALLLEEAALGAPPPPVGFDAVAYVRPRLRRPDLHLVVAERGGRCVGYAEGALLPAPAPASRLRRALARLRRRPRPEGAVCYVYVRPEARRAGVGRRLVEHLVAALRTRGARAVHASARAGNAPSVAMFRACGFAAVTVHLRLDPDDLTGV